MSALDDRPRDVSADEPAEPACEDETTHDIPVRRFVADVLLLLAIYAPIRLALFFPTFGLKFLPFELAHRPLTLPESAYAEPLVFPAALTHLPTLPWYVLSAGFVAAHFWAHPKNPLHRKLSWGLGEAPGLRWVALALMLPIVWKYGTMDVNLYFDQAHLLDRAPSSGSGSGPPCASGAAFLLAFGATFASQLYYPDIFHFTWADKAVLFYSALLIWVGPSTPPAPRAPRDAPGLDHRLLRLILLRARHREAQFHADARTGSSGTRSRGSSSVRM